MDQYTSLLNDILKNGNTRGDRTGTGTKSLFGRQMVFNLEDGFPLVTTKKTHLRAIIHELIFFLAGETNNNVLKQNGVSIWDEWALPEDTTLPDGTVVKAGELGPIYGKQWRSWEGADKKEIDQISELIHNLKTNPYSRRHYVSAWNVGLLPDEKKSHKENVLNGKMVLPPCHTAFQFYVQDLPFDSIRKKITDPKLLEAYTSKHYSLWAEGDHKKFQSTMIAWCEENGIKTKRLDMQLYQRSADFCLGVPFNIASYSLFLMMVAQVTNMVPGEFVHTFGDAHVYSNHIEKAMEQVGRKPFPLPKMTLNKEVKDIFSFKLSDFVLTGYEHHPAISYEIAI